MKAEDKPYQIKTLTSEGAMTVVPIDASTLSREFKDWAAGCNKESWENGDAPFTCSFMGTHYVCLESTDTCNLTPSLEAEIRKIKQFVGYPRAWVIRFDND